MELPLAAGCVLSIKYKRHVGSFGKQIIGDNYTGKTLVVK